MALAYLRKMDCCVSPWANEDIFLEKSARKTYEYLAAGKPIIVSNVVGKEQFLVENRNCLLYEPGNAISLLKNIEKLIDNIELSKEISYNNKELAKKFTWDRVIENSKFIKILLIRIKL